jgi:hypothetical protein
MQAIDPAFDSRAQQITGGKITGHLAGQSVNPDIIKSLAIKIS